MGAIAGAGAGVNVTSDVNANANTDADAIDKMYSKMAEVYTLSKKYGDALEYSHKALSINPNSEEAQCGMEALEKIMKYADNTSMNSSVSDDYRYQSRSSSRHHQHHSYRYDESELESVVRAIQ